MNPTRSVSPISEEYSEEEYNSESYHSARTSSPVGACAELCQQVAARLDLLHSSAAQSNQEEYFNCFTSNAIFIGTDPGERWTIRSFKEYVQPHFDSGKGWVYYVVSRNITFSNHHDIAWFDEELNSPVYGRCRGTGVLEKIENIWRISQYSLSFPVPNQVAHDVVKMIQ